jgi:hypothetical protein
VQASSDRVSKSARASEKKPMGESTGAQDQEGAISRGALRVAAAGVPKEAGDEGAGPEPGEVAALGEVAFFEEVGEASDGSEAVVAVGKLAGGVEGYDC